MQKNRIEIAGNLSAKPDRRFLPSGTKVANARLAENRSYRDKENKLITQTSLPRMKRATTYSWKEQSSSGSLHLKMGLNVRFTR
jgi:single-stranded DNA-binding protein